MTAPASPLEAVRLDVWLDVACLFKTRSQAANACKGGKVEVNGDRGKPNRLLRPGDTVRISRKGWRQILMVKSLADQHVPKAQARELYEDQTPPPTAEELAMRRLVRDAGLPHPGSAGAPDKRTRRELRRRKEGGGDPG